MKFTNLSLSFPGILTVLMFSLGGLSQAAPLVLIDGTGPVYTLNGSFESTGAATTFGFDPTGWVAINTDNVLDPAGLAETRSDNANEASHSGVIGVRSSNDNYNLVADTNQTGGYTISMGDVYTLSFDHIGLLGWDTGDLMRYSLFYTGDDTLSGVEYTRPNGTGTGIILNATVLFTGTVSVTPNTYNSTGPITTAAVSDAGAVNKHLFLAFTSAANSNEFARLDQVNLSVTAIPEPGSMVLVFVGLASCWFLVRKRKR